MIADVEWSAVSISGAFVLGAVIATFATIRIVRAVSTLFVELERRRRRPSDEE